MVSRKLEGAFACLIGRAMGRLNYDVHEMVLAGQPLHGGDEDPAPRPVT
jgi:hypothetical protein